MKIQFLSRSKHTTIYNQGQLVKAVYRNNHSLRIVAITGQA
jgi:hypothetical protein